MKKISLPLALAIVPVLFSSIAQASLGGGEFDKQYNRGTYTCADQKGELEGEFTFNAEASLVIKGQPVTLERTAPGYASAEVINVIRSQYVRPADIFVGQYSKGTVIVLTNNSAGNVQMIAVLLGSRGEQLAAARLNCKSQPAPKQNTGW